VVPLLVESGGYRERVRPRLRGRLPRGNADRARHARSGLSAEIARHHGRAGGSPGQRLAVADDVIDNGGELAALRAQVERLHAAYLAAATHCRLSMVARGPVLSSARI
jgi:dephospho-CoA kinase